MRFCKNYLVYPIHFLDENKNKYLREYVRDKQKCKSACYMDCFLEAEQEKEDIKLEHTKYYHICQLSYIALTDNSITMHFNSTKHKKNENKRIVLKTVLNLNWNYYLFKNCRLFAPNH